MPLSSTSPSRSKAQGASQLAISGDHAVGVFNIAVRLTVSLSDLTITQGNSAHGGGILNRGTLRISDSTLSDKRGPYRGGVHLLGRGS